MTASAERVYIFGRLRGLTKRSLERLAATAGLTITRGAANADAIVLGHAAASRAVSDSGELRLEVRGKAGVRLLSERAFRRRLGLERPPSTTGSFSEDQVARRAALKPSQLLTLALFDVLAPVEGGYSYADLVAARAAGRLHASGVRFPKIISAALALERRGESLSSVRLAEAPWGEVIQVLDGAAAEVDGQLLLPLDGADIDADAAFALAEESEQDGDFLAAKRWYELALRLDAADPVAPFNLGNVLDELGLPVEAEVAYRLALTRSPDMADAWFNLGVLQEKTGREAEALASYGHAFAIDRAYADALHNAALVHMRARRFAAAVPLLEQILSTAPANATEIRRLAQLCRLEAKADQAE